MNGQIVHSDFCSWLATGKCSCGAAKPTEMTSLVEIKSRLAAIEQGQRDDTRMFGDLLEKLGQGQGQGVICERLDGLEHHRLVDFGCLIDHLQSLGKATEEIRGALLLQQFAANASKTKKRGRR